MKIFEENLNALSLVGVITFNGIAPAIEASALAAYIDAAALSKLDSLACLYAFEAGLAAKENSKDLTCAPSYMLLDSLYSTL